MIEVGENSYVSLDKANNYISMIYDNEQKGEVWDSLTDIQKESKLIKACMKMQKLKFNNTSKYNLEQSLVFPRVAYNRVHGWILLGTNTKLGEYIYTDYELCQIEEAITGYIENKELESKGGKVLKSVTIGKVSESYSDTSIQYKENVRMKTGLTLDAYDFISDYFKGGV